MAGVAAGWGTTLTTEALAEWEECHVSGSDTACMIYVLSSMFTAGVYLFAQF